MPVSKISLLVATLFLTQSVFAQEAPDLLRNTLNDTKEIVVPEGSGDDVVQFLDDMVQMQQEVIKNYRDSLARIQAAQLQACNQILDDSDNVTDEQFYAAARLGLAGRLRGIPKADGEERSKLFDLVHRQLTIELDKGLQQSEMSNASTLASYLERYGDPELALKAYKSFSELLAKSDNPNAKRYGDQMQGSARRLGLLGSSLELEGKLMDGSSFDWEAYRGKVVLVDFWATWCGPCIAEAPNVRQQYELYHDLGFEVVGISLDTKQAALEAYIKKENVPWANLYEDGAGWKHPMAVRYGVNSIPRAVLVDREGKVVSLNARGAELPRLLSKLFNSKGDWERAAAIYSAQIEKNPADTRLLLRRAKAYMELEDWNAAGKDWDTAISLQSNLISQAFAEWRSVEDFERAAKYGLLILEKDPNDSNNWNSVAPYLHLIGKDDELRAHCLAMIEQFRDT